MSIGSLVEPLQRVAILQGLGPSQLSEIARRAERVQYKPGEILISEGTPGDAAYLIVSGTAKRTAGPGAGDSNLGPGTLLGEMAMLVETDYSSTVVCEEPVRALKITREHLLEQMSTDISLADHFLAELSGRLKQLAVELRNIDDTLAAVETPKPHAIRPAALALEAPPQPGAPH